MVGALQWNPVMNSAACAATLLAAGISLCILYRNLLRKTERSKAILLMAPRILLLMLLSIALFDPSWRRETSEIQRRKIAALLDVSGSMELLDRPDATRLQRARLILDSMRKNLPEGTTLNVFEFDSRLKPDEPPAWTRLAVPDSAGPVPDGMPADEPGYTDIAAALLEFAGEYDSAAYNSIIMLTDGGDEPVRAAKLPMAPISIIGVGSSPSTWNDLSIAEVRAPRRAEAKVDFEVSVDIIVRSGESSPFFNNRSEVTVFLEQEVDDDWAPIDSRKQPMINRRARSIFRVNPESTGVAHYRVRVEPIEEELSILNNTRRFSVDVHDKSLRVLYFTREIGMDFKHIRSELAGDPGISFTAIFRTASERFTVQSQDPSTASDLDAGFPIDPGKLAVFDCLIIGSVPAESWIPAQMEALSEYIENGGTAIFTGCEHFGPGGYADTKLADLLPWRVEQGNPVVMLGRFPVSIPSFAASSPIVAGIEALLADEQGAALDSLFDPGPVKAGAEMLLSSASDTRIVAVIAIHAFGKGRVMAIASNTFWRWARQSENLRKAHGLFWRQAVRNLPGREQAGRALDIRWDRVQYRPGEQASAFISVRPVDGRARSDLRLSASISDGETTTCLNAEPQDDDAGAFTVRMLLNKRADYTFRLSAYDESGLVETIEQTVRAEPLLVEGSNLEVDEDFLRRLAARGGGTYLHEDKAKDLLKHITSSQGRKTLISERPLIGSGPWFFTAAIILLLFEWILRRRMNMV